MSVAASIERIGGLLKKEFRQVFRDPRMVRVVFIAPMIQLLIFGYAVSTDVRHTPTLLIDLDSTAASRALTDTLTASGYFDIVERSDRPGAALEALDHGRVTLAMVIPRGFAEELESGRGTSVQLLFDGTNANLANVARGYAERIVLRHGLAVAPVPITAPIELAERAWYNPGLISRNYNVPAVVGAIIMLVCLLLTSLAIVREREIGTLEQLLVSPVRPWELIAGKTLPFAVIGLVDLVVVTAIALVWFGVPFRGNYLLVLGASLLYLFSGLGVGLLISTVSSTQQEAFMTTFLFYMPTMLLSGFLFPVHSMPALFRWVTLANPMRHYLDILRATFLKGVGLDVLWPQLTALTLLGIVIFGSAIARFRKRAM